MNIPRNKIIVSQSKQAIALVAHDQCKPTLLDWAKSNRKILIKHPLLATGSTGQLLQQKLNLDVTLLQSGPLGGDQQIGAKIVYGEIGLLTFFWDPLESQPHDPDVRALLRLAVLWNIPTACNRATADLIITSNVFQTDLINNEKSNSSLAPQRMANHRLNNARTKIKHAKKKAGKKKPRETRGFLP